MKNNNIKKIWLEKCFSEKFALQWAGGRWCNIEKRYYCPADKDAGQDYDLYGLLRWLAQSEIDQLPADIKADLMPLIEEARAKPVRSNDDVVPHWNHKVEQRNGAWWCPKCDEEIRTVEAGEEFGTYSEAEFRRQVRAGGKERFGEKKLPASVLYDAIHNKPQPAFVDEPAVSTPAPQPVATAAEPETVDGDLELILKLAAKSKSYSITFYSDK